MSLYEKAKLFQPLPFSVPPAQAGPGDTTWCLVLIRNNAADKVGLCGSQVGHQLVEVLLGVRRAGRSTEGGNQNWMPQWVGPNYTLHLHPFTIAPCDNRPSPITNLQSSPPQIPSLEQSLWLLPPPLSPA